MKLHLRSWLKRENLALGPVQQPHLAHGQDHQNIRNHQDADVQDPRPQNEEGPEHPKRKNAPGPEHQRGRGVQDPDPPGGQGPGHQGDVRGLDLEHQSVDAALDPEHQRIVGTMHQDPDGSGVAQGHGIRSGDTVGHILENDEDHLVVSVKQA